MVWLWLCSKNSEFCPFRMSLPDRVLSTTIPLIHLDPLESDGGILDAVRGVKAFGGRDVGIDHPLPEVVQRRTEALFQQLLLILAFPGGSQA